MSELFDVVDMVSLAVQDEKSGIAFYSELSKTAASPQLKTIFKDLTAQEARHQKRFEAMLADLGGQKTPEEYPGQYLAYLKILTGTRAFPDEATARQKAQECKSDLEALDLAARFERDTILLMNELRAMVPQKHQVIVGDLVAEERSHLVTLEQARQAAGR